MSCSHICFQTFHNYNFRKELEAYVDHKPLESLNNCNKKTNAGLERWTTEISLQDHT